MTAPGREGARQSRRPLPAARARGPGRALTWAGGREGALRVGTGPRRERAPQSPPAASRQPPVRAAEKAAGQPGERASLQLEAAAAAAATEPTRLPGPASVSAAVLGSPWRRHPRAAATLGAPEVTLRRRPPAVTPREPPIVSSQRRRRRRAAGTRGAMSPRARGPGRPFLSLSRRRPRAAHQPPAAPRLSPASPRPGSPAGLLTSSRAAAVSAGRPGGIGSLRTGGAGRGAACTSGTLEPERAEPGRSGQSRAAGTSLRTALQSRAGRVLLRSEGREHS